MILRTKRCFAEETQILNLAATAINMSEILTDEQKLQAIKDHHINERIDELMEFEAKHGDHSQEIGSYACVFACDCGCGNVCPLRVIKNPCAFCNIDLNEDNCYGYQPNVGSYCFKCGKEKGYL